VDFVLDEKVYQGYQSAKEGTSEHLPVLDGYWIRRAQSQTAQRPWQGSNQIADHEDVVPVVVVCRGDICPSSTGKRPEDANPENDLWQGRVGSSSEEVVEGDEGESRTGGQGDADHED